MIHPTAIVDESATLGDGVEVGAYAIVEAGVTLGDSCRLLPHAQVLAGTRMGSGNVVGRGAILGECPQDLSFDPQTESYVEIGEGNTFREHVTVHRSSKEGAATRIGDQNFLMAGAHLGHDTTVGDHCVLANNCLLAGFVEVGDRCFLGGGSVYHQFLRVGSYVMAQGNGAFSKDIPPYCMAALYNQLVGLNAVGLRRAGVSRETLRELRGPFQRLFRSGGRISESVAALRQEELGEFAGKLVDFVAAQSRQGICAAKKKADA